MSREEYKEKSEIYAAMQKKMNQDFVSDED